MKKQSKPSKFTRHQMFQLGLMFGAILFLCVLMYFVGRPLVQFVSKPEYFRDWVESKGILGVLAFIGMVILQVFLAIIPGGPFEVGAGYAFGAVKGTLLCDFATTLASLLVFLFVRKFGMKFVELFVSKEKIESVRFLKSSKKSESIIFLFFLIPGTPKDLLSYFCGLTEIRFSVFMAISTFCRIPALWASALGGDAMGDKSYVTAIVIFSIILLCTLLGTLIYFLIVKRHRKKNGKEEMQDN